MENNIQTLKNEIEARKYFLENWLDISKEKKIEFENTIRGMEIALNIMLEK